jgi:UDP-N-acetylglucosamine 2-epimerase (non-hydrolysing)
MSQPDCRDSKRIRQSELQPSDPFPIDTMTTRSTVKLLTVVGARPNFMKVAPLILAIRKTNDGRKGPYLEHVLVHTGQHYDALMSDQFFVDLSLPKPDVHLGVGSGSQAVQTAEILEKFDLVLSERRPDVVIVVGDVNSTLACALAVAKMNVPPNKNRPLIAHIEAGLRSFDRTMPEEINRIVTDHLADILFVTENSGIINLHREGIHSDKVFFVGNTMIDSVLAYRNRADKSLVLENLGLRTNRKGNGKPAAIRPYALLTLHRPANVDEPKAFKAILEGVSDLKDRMEIVFPVHPRTRKRITEFGLGRHFQENAADGLNAIRLIDPLGYLDFLCMMKNATLVLTDSGGVQEETTCLGVPCVTVRENTERPVTVEYGTNVIAGTSSDGIRRTISQQLLRKTTAFIPEKWDGKAAERIVPILMKAALKDPRTAAEAAQSLAADGN